MTKKNEKTPKKTTKTKSKDIKIDEKVRKQVLKEASDKMEKKAEKLALALKTEADLEVQAELTEQQEEAALLLACGFTVPEVSEKLVVSNITVQEWMKSGAFMRRTNELTIKEGSADKNVRIQKQKRIVEEMFQIFVERKNELKNIPLKDFMTIMLQQSQRMDSLVDKKEEDTKSKDITIMILSHVKTAQKEYSNLDEVFKEDAAKYPVIDAVSCEVVDNEG